jgi:hypothetical protein
VQESRFSFAWFFDPFGVGRIFDAASGGIVAALLNPPQPPATFWHRSAMLLATDAPLELALFDFLRSRMQARRKCSGMWRGERLVEACTFPTPWFSMVCNQPKFGVAMLPKESFIQWARECLAYEVSTNFTRAQMFNSFLCRIAIEALRRQPPEHLPVLMQLLPERVGLGYPESEILRSKLPLPQRRIVEDYRAVHHEIYLARHDELSTYIGKSGKKEFREEHKATSKRCLQTLKKIAADWDYDLVNDAGPGEWELIAWKRWGTILIDLCFRDMTLDYSLHLSEKGQVRGHFDSYLSALGLSVSRWDFESAAEAEEEFPKVLEFIRWHVDEYDRIVEASLPQQTPAQPGQTANPKQTGTP